ncbi:hypothetical protein [Streptomyces angustmyceticus]
MPAPHGPRRARIASVDPDAGEPLPWVTVLRTVVVVAYIEV